MNNPTFDEVFKTWLDAEVGHMESSKMLELGKSKGFSSITEWRLSTALRLGMDNKDWVWQTIENPNEFLPNIVVGPYKGWSQFFDNQLDTSFKQAMEIPEFLEWCSKHDRIIPLSQHFPLPTTIILYRKPNGKFIHIEGGHRICAVAYAQKIGKPINFEGQPPVTAAIADITEDEIEKIREFSKQGTNKK